MPKSTARILKLATILLLALSVSGCGTLGLGGEPGPDIGPDPLGLAFALPSLLDNQKLAVVLNVEETELKVGDTFTWWANLDNRSDKAATVKVFADYPSEVLRVDQTGGISDPLLGSNIVRVRAGLRRLPGHGASDLRGDYTIEGGSSETIDGTGRVLQGEGDYRLIQFDNVEIVLPGPGTYEVFMPVRVDWRNTYALGRRFEIREETRSNIVVITVQ